MPEPPKRYICRHPEYYFWQKMIAAAQAHRGKSGHVRRFDGDIAS
jgi:hypothetical protein